MGESDLDISETFLARMFEQVDISELVDIEMVGKKKPAPTPSRSKLDDDSILPAPKSSSPVKDSGRVKNPPSKKKNCRFHA